MGQWVQFLMERHVYLGLVVHRYEFPMTHLIESNLAMDFAHPSHTFDACHARKPSTVAPV